MRLFPAFFLIFLFFCGIAEAGTQVTINPTGANDQTTINQAIEQVSQAGGGEVYLNSGVYLITGTINLKSN
jgi:polygalacturonase